MASAMEIPEDVRAVLARLAEPRPMRRGSLSERWVKCSKPGCPCSEREEARHGPYLSLTRRVNGRTQSRLLSREDAEVVRAQIETDRRFREEVEEYRAACERWADALLEQPPQGGEKGGSRRASRRPSGKKSKR